MKNTIAQAGTFIEKNCTIEHEGKTFESGGSFLCNCSDGYIRGTVYAKYQTPHIPNQPENTGSGIVTTWHGEEIAKAHFFPAFFHNMSGRNGARKISFWYKDIQFSGQYSWRNQDCVNVRSTKKAVI